MKQKPKIRLTSWSREWKVDKESFNLAKNKGLIN